MVGRSALTLLLAVALADCLALGGNPVSYSNCLETSVTYEIIVKTGTKANAGTDSDVFITLVGDCGSTQKYYLDKSLYDDFEIGNEDSYMIYDRNIGTIKYIIVGMDPEFHLSGDSDWYLEKVIIMANGVQTTFPHQQWVTDGTEHRIENPLLLLANKTLIPGDETALQQTVPLMGHDNELRRHIIALENDFEELNNLDNEAWQPDDHVQKLLTSLTNAVTELRKVEDDVISLARTSRTDVTGLETHLNRFKRQVDGQLSTDNTYSGIMDVVGKLIRDSSDIMKKEIKDINEAESMLNTAQAEMTVLKNLLKHHEKHEDEIESAAETGIFSSLLTAGIVAFFDEDVAEELAVASLGGLARVWDHREKFDRIESNILSGFQYFREEVELVKEEEKEMRKLSGKYSAIRNNWGQGYDQDELEETAEEDDDWEEDVMADIRRLKSNVNKFVESAGHWSDGTEHRLENPLLIDFVGHDNGLRRHITALENDFEELDDLDNHAWQPDNHVQKLLTSLTNVVTKLRKVEDDVISLARTSRTDVTGLETHLNRFKKQVDDQLSTDNTYRGIMDLVGKLIRDSSDIMKKEIEEINEAESMLNTAQAEMTILKQLLRQHEKHVWDHREKFDRIETNILSGFQYFRKVAGLAKEEREEMRNLSRKYNVIRANWGYDQIDQDELEEIAEEDDGWEEDVMADIRMLKSNVNKFATSA